jgi:hypothetical protein
VVILSDNKWFHLFRDDPYINGPSSLMAIVEKDKEIFKIYVLKDGSFVGPQIENSKESMIKYVEDNYGN